MKEGGVRKSFEYRGGGEESESWVWDNEKQHQKRRDWRGELQGGRRGEEGMAQGGRGGKRREGFLLLKSLGGGQNILNKLR